MPKAYILPAEVREAILNYLGNRPYREVATGVNALLALAPLPDEPESESGTPVLDGLA
jgi:hypothetical protein